jgi:hypothetical protein
LQAQRQELLKQLSEHGWRIATQEEELEWWADEMWRLESLWTPVGAVAYVTFMVDPAVCDDRKKGESVWAVMASSAKPLSRQTVEGEFTVSLGHDWKQRLPAFFKHLAFLRSQKTEADSS